MQSFFAIGENSDILVSIEKSMKYSDIQDYCEKLSNSRNLKTSIMGAKYFKFNKVFNAFTKS